ncbi:unnamed protein product [Ambrosiozyma monospora]|uniref:Unnamed protein product n=1 Tax=Ambrosiozyma monospora TaxID=43982 RepID=A0A9W6YX39_AMBMO|nr:unnamed protein product [Ambrosiozyma monospora]
MVRTKPCNHTYHYSCISKWTHRSNSCPTCRRDFEKVEKMACCAAGAAGKKNGHLMDDDAVNVTGVEYSLSELMGELTIDID